jgi:hypothetical protein
MFPLALMSAAEEDSRKDFAAMEEVGTPICRGVLGLVVYNLGAAAVMVPTVAAVMELVRSSLP